VLTITIPLSESFDDESGQFLTEGVTLQFEHSLASLSKWEAKYEKPFLSREEKTVEESLYYYEDCMLLTKNPPAGIFENLTRNNVNDIHDYINGKHTATWFHEDKNKPRGASRQVVTSAVVYGWMTAMRIPFEAEKWHLNQLFDLIRVCNEQQKTPKKMGRADAARQQAQLNAQRKAQMGTRG
jgi:hypothetical protein